MSTLEPRYTGYASIDVWRRIARIEKEPESTLIYLAACALQDHEQRFFQMLKAVETPRSPQESASE